jgi:hypothetical protein
VQAGKYIEARSQPTDKIYVWGWVPGIYVQAQRMSSAPKAFEGTMHTLPPNELARRVRELLDAFAKEPPKFIVDTQNRHFPWDRPPLQLWPDIDNGYGLWPIPGNNEQAWRRPSADPQRPGRRVDEGEIPAAGQARCHPEV